MADYYKILGVSHNATLSEIRRAYRKKVKELHPDKTGTSETSEEFSKVILRRSNCSVLVFSRGNPHAKHMKTAEPTDNELQASA